MPAGLTGLSGGNEASVYFLLSPEDWNDSLNEALEELFKVVRVEIDIVAGDSLYPLDSVTDAESDLCTWLQSRTQVYGVEYRRTNGATVSLEQLGGVRFLENNNSLSVLLTMPPVTSDAGATLELVARKPYVWRDSLLSTDATTTNCPYKLAMVATQVKAFRLLFKRHGETMKRQFGAAIVIAERELTRTINELVPSMRPQPLMVDESFEPDIPPEMQRWSW
jgi:hypothetical protein